MSGEKELSYEVSVYSREKGELIFDKATDSFVAVAVDVSVRDDGKVQHEVRVKTAELNPLVVVNICLALLEQNPTAKDVFKEAFDNLKKKESDGHAE